MHRDDLPREPWTTPQLRSSEADVTAYEGGAPSDGTEGSSLPFSRL